MTQASLTTTTPVKAAATKPRKPRKAKRGGLTRAERTARLRARPGYATAVLLPGGVPFTCREADGFIAYAEVEQAIFDATGRQMRFRRYLSTKAGQAALATLSGGGDSAAQIGADEYLSGMRIPQGAFTIAYSTMTQGFSPTSAALTTTRAATPVKAAARKPRKARVKGGRLTRARKPVPLWKQPGYSPFRLIPGAEPITRRDSDRHVNYSEVARVASAVLGKQVRVSDWMRRKGTIAAIEEHASSAQIRADQVFDRGDGQDAWGPAELLPSFVAWFAPQWLPAVTAALMNAANRRIPRTPEQKALQGQRGQALRSLTDVLQEKGVVGQEYQRVLGQITYLVTGHAPKHWQEALGVEDWLAAAAPDFQKAMVLVRQTLAGHFRRLDLAVMGEGKVRHFNALAKEVMPEIRGTLEFWGLPWTPIPAVAVLQGVG